VTEEWIFSITFALFSISILIVAPIAGAYVDKFPMRGILLAGLLVSVGGQFMVNHHSIQINQIRIKPNSNQTKLYQIISTISKLFFKSNQFEIKQSQCNQRQLRSNQINSKSKAMECNQRQ
jgi:hypothetical protein